MKYMQSHFKVTSEVNFEHNVTASSFRRANNVWVNWKWNSFNQTIHVVTFKNDIMMGITLILDWRVKMRLWHLCVYWRCSYTPDKIKGKLFPSE